MAQRTQEAQARIIAAAEQLAKQYGLSADLTAALARFERDPEIRLVQRQEAVAEFLEALIHERRMNQRGEAEPAAAPSRPASRR